MTFQTSENFAAGFACRDSTVYNSKKSVKSSETYVVKLHVGTQLYRNIFVRLRLPSAIGKPCGNIRRQYCRLTQFSVLFRCQLFSNYPSKFSVLNSNNGLIVRIHFSWYSSKRRLWLLAIVPMSRDYVVLYSLLKMLHKLAGG